MRFAWVLAFVLGGCGLALDLDPPDTQLDFDAGRGSVCASAPDGQPCGEGLICLDERCVRSRCGDGFIDTSAGETCEDGNDISGDGCEPGSCRFSCERDADCHVSGCVVARCNDAHVCELEALPEETSCGHDANQAGVCRGGACIPSSCGNGMLDPGEACDDGNHEPGDGCEPDCTLICETDADCDDGIECNGVERCVLERADGQRRAQCVPDPEPPSRTCFECDLRTGRWELIDEDGDGWAPYDDELCEGRGGDCDDADPTVHPGAPDFAHGDGIDNDCDGDIDEESVTVCWQDKDGDGFGVPVPMSVAAQGVCPLGTIPASENTTMPIDCDDDDTDVFPGQRAFFTTSRCDRPGAAPGILCWDYDCDGQETLQWPRAAACTRGLGCSDEGWGLLDGLNVPRCGESGDWVTCIHLVALCAPQLSGGSRTQGCR